MYHASERGKSTKSKNTDSKTATTILVTDTLVRGASPSPSPVRSHPRGVRDIDPFPDRDRGHGRYNWKST